MTNTPRSSVPMLALAVLLESCGGSGSGGAEPQPPASSAKAITAFSFARPAAAGSVDEDARAIALTVPIGAPVTALVATFTTTGANARG